PRKRGSSIPEAAKGYGEAAAYWIARSSWAMTAECVGRRYALRSLLAIVQPLPHPCIGFGVLGDVGNDGDGIGAGGKDLGGVLELAAADGDKRDGADALLPLGDLRNALRREAHR